VLVTLGTLQRDAQEQVCRRTDELGRRRLVVVLVGEDEERLRPIALLAVRGDEIRDDPVPAAVLVELIGQPGDESVGRKVLVVVEVALDEHIGPDLREVPAVLRRGEQFIDELAALERVGAVEEGDGAIARRDAAGEIEINPTQKLGITADWRGGHPRAGQGGVNLAVDARREAGRRRR
jgi:hypothetical protein